MEVFDQKTTGWHGLWWHPEWGGFSSQGINLAQLREFKGNVRILVRKNKHFNGGENNRPNYVFCIKDSNSTYFSTMEVRDEKYAEADDDDEKYIFTKEELQDLINRVACTVGGDREYGMNIVEDFI